MHQADKENIFAIRFANVVCKPSIGCSVNVWYGLSAVALKSEAQKPRFLMSVKKLSTWLDIDYKETPQPY